MRKLQLNARAFVPNDFDENKLYVGWYKKDRKLAILGRQAYSEGKYRFYVLGGTEPQRWSTLSGGNSYYRPFDTGPMALEGFVKLGEGYENEVYEFDSALEFVEWAVGFLRDKK